MDKNSYKGSMTDESNTSSHNKLAEMEEEDLQNDIKKHLNVDFSGDEEDEKLRKPRRSSVDQGFIGGGLADELNGMGGDEESDTGYGQQSDGGSL